MHPFQQCRDLIHDDRRGLAVHIGSEHRPITVRISCCNLVTISPFF